MKRVAQANAVTAMTLLAIWIIADFIDVSRGQSYVPSHETVMIQLSIVIGLFFFATWLALSERSPWERLLIGIVTAIPVTVAWVLLAQIFMIYFHVAIGGYL